MSKLSKGNITSIIILCSIFSLLFGLAIYTKNLDPYQRILTFTVAESRQVCLDWANCTRVTFSDGNGLTFTGLYKFEVGKTYTVTYARHKTLEGSKILDIQEVK